MDKRNTDETLSSGASIGGSNDVAASVDHTAAVHRWAAVRFSLFISQPRHACSLLSVWCCSHFGIRCSTCQVSGVWPLAYNVMVRAVSLSLSHAVQAERQWVQQASRQLRLSKVMRAWVAHIRSNQRQQALAVAAQCHHADVLMGRALHAWMQAHQKDVRPLTDSHLSLCNGSFASAWTPGSTTSLPSQLALSVIHQTPNH